MKQLYLARLLLLARSVLFDEFLGVQKVDTSFFELPACQLFTD